MESKEPFVIDSTTSPEPFTFTKLVDEEGTFHQSINVSAALSRAKIAGLDLVCFNEPSGELTALCKIINYGKWKYQVEKAKKKGLKISCDLNFRKKLWRWKEGYTPEKLASECLSAILPFVDVVLANEEDAKDVLGIEPEGTSVEEGRINARGYAEVAKKITGRFPNVGKVAITLRESISASHNNWGGMLYDRKTDQAFFAPLNRAGQYEPYRIKNIVDRVGSGDSFAAGLIYALNTKEYQRPASAIGFAVAASCLKHSIKGDFNYVTREEVETLMKGSASGRVRR